MTYNFDPDKWYDNEIYVLQLRLKKKEISQDTYDEKVADLDKKHQKMWERLNNTYQISREPIKKQNDTRKTD